MPSSIPIMKGVSRSVDEKCWNDIRRKLFLVHRRHDATCQITTDIRG